MAGKVKNAYILCRPPGHHATRSVAQGYCFFNNVSIAASNLHSHFNMQRVAIVDFDVHHGNGTQEQWYSSDKVLFISLHQDGLYPLDSGHVNEVGEGAGKGYNLNVPLPPGSARGAYMAAFDSVVIPALQAYKPEFIIVSSGLDASFLDPLGRMLLTSEDFKEMTLRLKSVAKEVCGEKMMFVHEGGYSELYTPIVGVKIVEALLEDGGKSHLKDPFIRDVGSPNWIACQPHQMQAVEAAKKNLSIALIPS
jgi:acetoin utilization deacetylase AcuC-like enzyme